MWTGVKDNLPLTDDFKLVKDGNGIINFAKYDGECEDGFFASDDFEGIPGSERYEIHKEFKYAME